MTYEQIINLTDKGFTPDQIVKLTGEEIPEPVPEAAPEETPEQNSETPAQIPLDPKQEPEQKPDSGSLSSVLSEAIKGFSAEVAEMKKALQATNIRTVVREDNPPSASADDILAGLIHPSIDKEENKK